MIAELIAAFLLGMAAMLFIVLFIIHITFHV